VESSARIRNALLTAAGVLGAVVLVAIAARGSTSTGDSSSRKPSDALADVLFSLYIVAVIAGAVMFIYLLVLRRHLKLLSGQAPRRSLLEMLASMFILLAAAALLARRLNWERAPPIEPEEAVGPAQTVDSAAAPPTSYEADVSWISVIITVSLIVLAVAAWWYSGRARRRARGELQPALAAAVAQAVDESLDDLRAEPDPRRAVIAAYARLERVLAAHGLPRKPSEAPLEYLGRMLTELSVSDRAARALTELFERAKFSQHAVGSEMKEEAIEALQTVRDDLLAAQALAEQERKAGIEAQREQAGAAQ
jgi:peptidoglycan/LPS O-acetylase OafA/YrhL